MKGILAASCLLFATGIASASGPTITIWSGLNQSFGQIGNPQAAINILGNVTDANGVTDLSYTLNGGSSVQLSQGPDTRRLLAAGDFNIDINISLLNAGSNTIVITARNGLDQLSTETVNVQYTPGQTWPLPYTIDWNTAGSIENVAQIVDGHWTLDSGRIYSTYLGYDRLVAIGDTAWTDYEVTVPITICSLDSSGFNNVSQTPGVGLLFRWTGHTDYPISGMQPKSGYLPLGAIGWYSWEYMNPANVRLNIVGNNLHVLQTDYSGFHLTFGVSYYFKMRVETIPNVGGRYRLKVWQVGDAEPFEWRLEGQQSLSDPQKGSVLLLSHHVDARFGNVVITPVPDPVPVQLSSFTATLQEGNTVRLNWSTISETNNYGFEVQKSGNGTPFATLPNGFIPGHGTTLEPRYYSFVDSSTAAGDWSYRLKQIDLDGTFHFTDPVHISVTTGVDESRNPGEFALHQNYPNPFNPSTIIMYDVPADSRVRLDVFNTLGQHIALLVDDTVSKGRHTTTFDASSLTTGVYICRLTTSRSSISRRMMVVK